ncbi:hypothetical protein THAOC_06777, partial [Thalassiosira oceanica]
APAPPGLEAGERRIRRQRVGQAGERRLDRQQRQPDHNSRPAGHDRPPHGREEAARVRPGAPRGEGRRPRREAPALQDEGEGTRGGARGEADKVGRDEGPRGKEPDTLAGERGATAEAHAGERARRHRRDEEVDKSDEGVAQAPVRARRRGHRGVGEDVGVLAGAPRRADGVVPERGEQRRVAVPWRELPGGERQ